MAITPIVGTLAYILDQESDRVLLIRRNSRPDDDHFGKVNGLGGKVEKDESIVCGIEREIEEEVGVLPKFKKVIRVLIFFVIILFISFINL